MALYIPHSIFHLARLLYVRPETFGPYYVCIKIFFNIMRQKILENVNTLSSLAGEEMVHRLWSPNDHRFTQKGPSLFLIIRHFKCSSRHSILFKIIFNIIFLYTPWPTNGLTPSSFPTKNLWVYFSSFTYVPHITSISYSVHMTTPNVCWRACFNDFRLS